VGGALFMFTALLTFASTSIIVRYAASACWYTGPESRLGVCAHSKQQGSYDLYVVSAYLCASLAQMLCRYASDGGFRSYSDLVRHHFGRAGATVLQLAIVTHVFGVMIG
jgi:hypothetical protein